MDTKFSLEDSLQLLANNYHKILRINLTEDSHTELKMYADKQEFYNKFPQFKRAISIMYYVMMEV